MSAAQFGEMLRRFVPLSNHDVAEILEHQAVSRRKFGEIALSWGLCRPDQVWAAWWTQLAHERRRADLEEIGIDAQSVGCLPARIAREFGVLPVRVLDEHLILAAADETLGRAEAELPQRLNRKIAFVLADAGQIEKLMRRYYDVAGAATLDTLPAAEAVAATAAA